MVTKAKPKSKEKRMDEAYDLLQSDPDEFIRRAGYESPVVFAEANLKNEKGDDIDFENHEFQRQYMNDFAPNLCVKKASQTGITTTSMAKVLYLAHIPSEDYWARLFRKKTNGITMIYTFPTARDVEDFSATRFKTMVNSSPRLVDMLGGHKGVDAVGRKRIGNSTIFFRGSTKATQSISIPADLIVNDEFDFSAPNIVEILQSRLTKSQFKWWWKFSTPTLPHYGIDAEYEQSNQFRWIVKCTRCRRRQEVKWPKNIGRKKIRGKRYVFWACRSCGKELDRTYGRWEPKFPSREYHGYFVPPGICPWIQPLDVLASRKIYRTDKNFKNFALGEAYTDGENLLTREIMLRRIRLGDPWNPTMHPWTFMGVDQGDVLHYTISRMDHGKRVTFKVGTTKTFNDIGGLMQEYNVAKCVMDALPNKKSAQKFADDFPGRVFLSIYKEFDETEEVKESKNLEHGILIDRTNSLDDSARSWREGESEFVLDQYSYMRIPPEIDDPRSHVSFVQQMGNMVRDEVENKKTGKTRAVWVKTGPDHFRHADTYNYQAWKQEMASDISGLFTYANPLMNASLIELAANHLVIPGRRGDWYSQF